MHISLNTAVKGLVIAALLLGGFQNCGFSAAKFGDTKLNSLEVNYKRPVAFAEVFEKVLIPTCVKCHNATTGKFDMTSYSSTTSRIDWIDLDFSPILVSVLSGTMPQSDSLSDEEKELVSDWILSGASEYLPGPNDPPLINRVNTVTSVKLNSNGSKEISTSVVVADAGYQVASYNWESYSGQPVAIQGVNTDRVNILFTQVGTSTVRLTVRGRNGRTTVRDLTFDVTGSSATPTPSSTPAATPTPTATPKPTASPTATPKPTATPTATPKPTATPNASRAKYSWLLPNVLEPKKCTFCHSSMGTYSGLTGNDKWVKSGNASGSGIYYRTISGSMPAGGLADPLNADETDAIKAWITNGALNN